MFLLTAISLFFIAFPTMLWIDSAGELQKLFLILVRICHGWIQAYIFVPYLLLTETFDVNVPTDKCKIHLWWGIGTVGDAIGLLAIQMMDRGIGLQWNISFLICVGVSLLVSVFQYTCIREVSMDYEEHESKINYMIEVKE